MNAGSDGPAGPQLTRRMLLVTGGTVLLAACGTAEPVWRPVAGLPGHPARTTRRPDEPHRALLRAARGQPGRAGPRHDPRGTGSGPVAVAARDPISVLPDGSHVIALTIDDGPSPVYTPQVLRLLERYQVTASFSMVGVHVAAYPALARAVAEAGHLIVNHTWMHLNLSVLPAAGIRDEMARTTGAIYQATGRTPAFFRAPYGDWSPGIMRQCADLAMAPLGWSVYPRDWSMPGVTEIVSNIEHNTRSGSIILEHDGGGNRSQTVAALGIVLPRLLAAGYRFATP
jgi:peptidoglycan/xylan/chitin deacetylase (PgdA/CDA1 family)